MKMIVTRPDYDPATKYLSYWSRVLIDEAQQKGIDIIDLAGKKATRQDFEGRVRKLNPSLVVLNGHGNAECVTGQDAEVLVKAGDNSALLAGRLTYAVSCDSAAVLGAEVGMHSKTAYVGYEKQFAVLQSHGYFKEPSKDPLAKPFLEFSNQVVRGLLKGNTVGESVEKAKQTGRALVDSLLSSGSDSDMQAAARFLWWDIQCLVVKGDQNKRIK